MNKLQLNALFTASKLLAQALAGNDSTLMLTAARELIDEVITSEEIKSEAKPIRRRKTDPTMSSYATRNEDGRLQ